MAQLVHLPAMYINEQPHTSFSHGEKVLGGRIRGLNNWRLRHYFILASDHLPPQNYYRFAGNSAAAPLCICCH
jgi:hypothetical protein